MKITEDDIRKGSPCSFYNDVTAGIGLQLQFMTTQHRFYQQHLDLKSLCSGLRKLTTDTHFQFIYWYNTVAC